MPPLARDIWIQITEEHLDRHDWLTLSKTSLFFKSIAQASLYRNVAIWRRRRLEESHGVNKTFILFSRTMEERPGLGVLVRSLKVKDDYVEDLAQYTRHPMLSKFGLFPQLRKLKLCGFRIEDNFCSIIRSFHPLLVSVEFDRCSVASQQSTAYTQITPEVHFSKLSITHPDNSRPAGDWSAIVPGGIQELIIINGSSLTDTEYDNALLSGLTKQGRTYALTKLVVEFRDRLSPSFIPFLISSPQLRSLAIAFAQPNTAGTVRLGSLPQEAIPQLEEFRGSVEFLSIIAPGRPVHTVHLSVYMGCPVDVLLPLQFSTTSIVELKFDASPWRINYGTFLQYAPTSIRRLMWDDARKTTILSCISALGRLSSLHTVKGRISAPGSRNIKELHEKKAEVVQKFSVECPSIKEFDFLDERWLSRQPHGWERYVAC